MNLLETNRYLTWLSQADGRVKVTEPNAVIWQNALANATSQEVFDATLEFTRTNDGVMVTPAAIRRMAFATRERAVAKLAALAAAPAPQRNPLSWRQKNPELWDRLFQEGRDDWHRQHPEEH